MGAVLSGIEQGSLLYGLHQSLPGGAAFLLFHFYGITPRGLIHVFRKSCKLLLILCALGKIME